MTAILVQTGVGSVHKDEVGNGQVHRMRRACTVCRVFGSFEIVSQVSFVVAGDVNRNSVTSCSYRLDATEITAQKSNGDSSKYLSSDREGSKKGR